ncbi:unnamed protein product, partial [Closterium sp. NIES-54]
TAHALYDAIVARDSLPATAALGRLLLPYVFPELFAFATVEDLHLLAAETSVAAVGAALGTPRTPFFEGCSPSPLGPSYACGADVDVLSTEDVGAASASAKRRSSKGKGGRGGGGGNGSGGGGNSGGSGGSGGGGSGGTGGGSGGVGGGGGGSCGSGGSGSGGSGGGRTGAQRGASGGGQRQWQQRQSETPSPQQLREWLFQRRASGGSVSCPYHRCFSRLDDAWRVEFGDEVERPHWAELLRSGVAIFDLDYDAILSAMYALYVSAEGDCYQCVPLDPGIEAAALGASESSLPGTVPAQALHTFTLDSGASRCFFRESTTLTLLPAPVPTRLSDPSGGLFVARSSTVLPCPSVPSSSLSGLHLPSFSTNLVSTAALQDAMVTTTTPGGQRVSICTSGSTPSLVTPPVAPDSSVAPPHGSPLLATPSWHALPSPCLWSSQQHAAPHSSSFPSTSAPLQTLHMDVWDPARVSRQGRERYFLLVVDDYTRYTTVFPLRSKGQVVDALIPWIRAVCLQLRERFRQDLPVLRLHSDRGGEFSTDLLQDICRGEGILQSFMLPNSPQENGIAERCIGLVMEVARTSMIHAAAAHFLWPFAVRYVAHQLNLWPRVSLPETSPTLRWTGEVGDASVFRVWGSHAFVRDTSADKLSAHAVPCVFLGFSPDAPGWKFYHPTSHRVFPSQDVTFDKSVPFNHLFAYRSAPPPPPPLFLAPAWGVEPGGAEPGGAESEGAEFEGAEPRGAASSGGSAGASSRLSPQQL